MSHEDQIPFDHPELVANPEPRCACLLLLDASGSMHGPLIRPFPRAQRFPEP